MKPTTQMHKDVEMNIKNFLKRACAFFFTVSLAAVFRPAFSNAEAFKKEYKMQVTVGPTFYWSQGAAKFAELVKEKTGGQVTVKPYYGSSLLQGAQLKSAQLVAKGVIDCAFESTINISPVISECNIFALPFFINTFENLDRLENGKTGDAIFAALQKTGLMPLAWGENGFRQITNDKKPIHRPDDLIGMKVRIVGSEIFIDTFRQLGADPLNMNWGDAVTAFQQGVVDAQENPVGVLIPVQIWQYHRHVTLWNYQPDPLIIYWNKKQWDAFPENIRRAIQSAAISAARFEKALCRAGLDGDVSLNILKNDFGYFMDIPDPVSFLKNKGMTVTPLSESERAAFVSATKPVFDQWAIKIGKDLVDTAKRDMGME
jgi:tripartite ATP-independent transporter DctP family solute receptor